MSDVLKRVEEADQKIEALGQEIKDLEASALAHEEQARKDRARRVAAKTEQGQWMTARNSLGVRKAVEDAAQSAKLNEQKTAAALADVEKMKAELADMLAKAKAAEPAKQDGGAGAASKQPE